MWVLHLENISTKNKHLFFSSLALIAFIVFVGTNYFFLLRNFPNGGNCLIPIAFK